MRVAAGLDAVTTRIDDEPDEMTATLVPCHRIETERGRIDVQTLESGRMGRRLLVRRVRRQ
jgi:hypothetical protein